MHPITEEAWTFASCSASSSTLSRTSRHRASALYNTQGITDLFDRVVLASGTSNRQTRALASHVADKVKQAGGQVISVEGEDTGEWLLVDVGDAVVRIMQPAIRAYYNLEEIWARSRSRCEARKPCDADAPGRAGRRRPAMDGRPPGRRSRSVAVAEAADGEARRAPAAGRSQEGGPGLAHRSRIPGCRDAERPPASAAPAGDSGRTPVDGTRVDAPAQCRRRRCSRPAGTRGASSGAAGRPSTRKPRSTG
jgi:ribosome-associated protein